MITKEILNKGGNIMKKIMLVLVFMFVVTMGAAAEFHGNIEMGYVPEVESFEAELNVHYLPWGWLDLSAGVVVLMKKDGEGLFFNPYRDTYSVGATINFTENIYGALSHLCAHPVVSNSWTLDYWDSSFAGNKTKISIGLKW